MNYLLAILIVSASFAAMAVGVIFARKVLRKGCSADPNDPNAICACKAQEETALKEKIDDDLLKIHPRLKRKE